MATCRLHCLLACPGLSAQTCSRQAHLPPPHCFCRYLLGKPLFPGVCGTRCFGHRVFAYSFVCTWPCAVCGPCSRGCWNVSADSIQVGVSCGNLTPAFAMWSDVPCACQGWHHVLICLCVCMCTSSKQVVAVQSRGTCVCLGVGHARVC